VTSPESDPREQLTITGKQTGTATTVFADGTFEGDQTVASYLVGEAMKFGVKVEPLKLPEGE
jgi:hypothetical protein